MIDEDKIFYKNYNFWNLTAASVSLIVVVVGLLYTWGIFSSFKPEINQNEIYLVPATAFGENYLNFLIPFAFTNNGGKGGFIKNINLHLIHDGKTEIYKDSFEADFSKFINTRCLVADILQGPFLPIPLSENGSERSSLLFITDNFEIVDGNYEIEIEIETNSGNFITSSTFNISTSTVSSYLKGNSIGITKDGKFDTLEPSSKCGL